MLKRKKSQVLLAVVLSIAILVIDQVIKIAVKTGMYMHESIKVTDWFYILFTENKGMAFGLDIFNKYFLTSFRIIAVALLFYYIIKYGTGNRTEIFSQG